jgi:hypothetical protein
VNRPGFARRLDFDESSPRIRARYPDFLESKTLSNQTTYGEAHPISSKRGNAIALSLIC